MAETAGQLKKLSRMMKTTDLLTKHCSIKQRDMMCALKVAQRKARGQMRNTDMEKGS